MTKQKTGMGTDAFFQTPVRPAQPTTQPVSPAEEKAERRSFNLRPSILRLLDEIQIKTMRSGDKWTLSAIIERGIELAAAEMGVHDKTNARISE